MGRGVYGGKSEMIYRWVMAPPTAVYSIKSSGLKCESNT